jgi:putative ABC transport system permease protein
VRAAHLDRDLTVDTAAQLTARISKAIGQQLTPFDALQRSLLLVAFVAVLSTLLLVGVQRRRELGLLAAVGMEPVQLGRMTLAEGVAAGVIGIGLSLGGAIIITVGFYWVLPILIGFRDPLRFDFISLAFWAPAGILLVAVAALLPAWRNAHLEVLEALQYE